MKHNADQLNPDTGQQDPWCEIRLADRVMRYRRFGAGRPLVLLSELADAGLWPASVTAIAGSRRVYIPDLTRDDTGFVTWLQGFMDGVGAERPAILATGALCIAALEFALLEADRVERLALIPAGQFEETGLDGVLAPSRDGPSLPILLLRRDYPDAAAVERLTRFFGSPARD